MFIPLRDDNPSYSFPFVTMILIVVNVFIYLASGLTGATEFVRNLYTFGFIPAELFHGEVVTQIPSEYLKLIMAEGDSIPKLGTMPAFLTIFTGMFMHGSFFHLLGNMWFLWLFGDNIEDRMGALKFFLFYILTGFIAAIAHGLTATNSIVPAIGASGAISGVIGAYIILFPNAKIHTLFFYFLITTIRIPAYIFLGFWFIGQVLSGFYSLGVQGAGIAFFAHIGGFIAGVILVKLFAKRNVIQLRMPREQFYIDSWKQYDEDYDDHWR
ncbi:MAG: rhomboid family intramembrane serine protease [bacterium]